MYFSELVLRERQIGRLGILRHDEPFVGAYCVISALAEERVGTVVAGLAALFAGALLEVLCEGVPRQRTRSPWRR
jgi:hypothetical protein